DQEEPKQSSRDHYNSYNRSYKERCIAVELYEQIRGQQDSCDFSLCRIASRICCNRSDILSGVGAVHRIGELSSCRLDILCVIGLRRLIIVSYIYANIA